MLRLDLARLGREGTLRVDARVPADDPIWNGMEGVFDAPVDVLLRATYAGTGEIVVRGTVTATVRQGCRRCLEPVSTELAEELTMVFLPSDSPGAEGDADVRLFKPNAVELDLSEPVREEMILGMSPYVVCDPDCRGLCPECGANRNNETCSCTRTESEPRWDALRALKEE
ncbi:MAG: DUF177 domain-containing protein [Longimicrobiales bacterium]|nr:DUF177 domain-containing protein [Longimicrobiales bacterium]